MGGKRETSDSHSMASASSHRSDSGRKTTRFSTLRRVIQDMQQQRMSSSRRRKPTSSSSAETDPRASSAALSSGDVVGWPSTSCRAVDDSRVGSTSPALDEEELSGTSHDTTIAEDLDCPLCTLSQPSAELLRVTSGCPHRMCRTCLHRYLNIEIMESRVNVECPACPERLHPNDIRRILGASANALELLGKYEEFTLRRLLVHEPDARWCPAPDCGYVVIASGCASCPKLTCERPGCNTLFCYHCKQTWHPNQTCDAARAERASNQRASLACSQDSGSQSDIKPCPRCGAFIVKMDDGSCNHMTCAMCGAEFCWLCMKEISDLHYLSPSGCTFWGKKPWSRKKKILWQLGTLIGAPVGITLIAAIAVPAIIIGVPVWVGKKLYARCAAMSKHKRNGVVAGGVIAATLVSPVIAALAVGIGVPILLAYVYGVVPISLCRSGGCGVSTTDTGGVRIDFDESDVRTENNPSQFNASDTRSVVETDGHRAINPSIGPSIGEMSVGLTNSLSASGSHLDRVGVIREDCDRDSASQQAIAGSCINASLSGSMHLAGPSGYQHRLEVQAEVTVTHAQHQKRSSLSSESANFSIDAKSVTVSFGDNTSVVALAGSICNRDKDNVSAVLSIADVPLASDSAPTNNQPPSCTTASVSSPSYVVSMPPIDDHSSVPRASFHRYGSPPSSLRSVSFVHGDVMHADGSVTSSNVGALSRPSYKRQGISVTDSIDECAESVSVFDDTVVDVCRNEPVGVVVKPGADHKAAVQLPHSVLPEVSGCSFRDSDRSRPISDADFCRAVTVGIATSCADDGDVDGLSATSSFNTASLSDYCSIGVEDRVLCLDSSTASSSVPLDRSMPTSHV